MRVDSCEMLCSWWNVRESSLLSRERTDEVGILVLRVPPSSLQLTYTSTGLFRAAVRSWIIVKGSKTRESLIEISHYLLLTNALEALWRWQLLLKSIKFELHSLALSIKKRSKISKWKTSAGSDANENKMKFHCSLLRQQLWSKLEIAIAQRKSRSLSFHFIDQSKNFVNLTPSPQTVLKSSVQEKV